MTLVSLKEVFHAYGDHTVLDRISWQITAGQKIGLIGANGSGKTTLFRIIAGELEADGGEVHRGRDLKIGFLQQEAQLKANSPLFQELTKAFPHLLRLEKKISEFEGRMAHTHGEELAQVMRRYSHLRERYREDGGYTYHHRIKTLLFGLRFREEDVAKRVNQLSGGQKNIAALAQVLLTSPDLLLLDEPTNHLDLEATQWLEQFLSEYAGTVIIVSHDRYLLDRTVEEIAELHNGRLSRYSGNYTAYVALRQKESQLQEKRYRLNQGYIQRTEEFIRRNIVGQKTKQAQSRRKMLTRLERIERPSSRQRTLRLNFPSDRREGREVLSVERLGKRYDQRILFENLSFSLLRGDRMAIVGPNGSGKTTVLRILMGQEEPFTGEVRWGHQVEIGHYDQEHRDLGMENRVLDEVWQACPHLQGSELRGYLAKFLFVGDDVFRPVKSLSGGEQSRVVLAKLMLTGANLLILDEPTNHLDIPSRTALEKALSEYRGTLLIVSHDRYFLDRVARRILFLESGTGREYLGNYSDFRQKRETETNRQALRKKKKKQRRKPKRGTKHLEKVEVQIDCLEQQLQKIETLLSSKEVASNWEKLQELLQQKSALSLKLDEQLQEWERAMADREM